MNPRQAVEIKDEDIEAYRRDGVVVLRGVIGEHWIELLREAVDKDLAKPGPDADIYSKPGEPLHFSDFDMWKRIPEFRDYAFNSPMAEIAARLMGSKRVNFYYDQFYVKDPGARDAVTPWHQDQLYMPVDGMQFCSTWAPLDPIPRESGVVFVKGSHRWCDWFAIFDPRRDNKSYEGKSSKRAPEIHSHRKEDVVSWNTEPGDCLVWRARTLHKGRGNQSSKKRRRAVVNRWLGDDATYFVREGRAKEAYEPSDLSPGEPMRNSRDYPRVWPRGRLTSPGLNRRA